MITIENSNNVLGGTQAIINTKTGETVFFHSTSNTTPDFNFTPDSTIQDDEALNLVKIWAKNPDVPSDIRGKLYDMLEDYIDLPDLIYEAGQKLTKLNAQEYNSWAALMYGHLDDYPHTGWDLVDLQDRLTNAKKQATQKEECKDKVDKPRQGSLVLTKNEMLMVRASLQTSIRLANSLSAAETYQGIADKLNDLINASNEKT